MTDAIPFADLEGQMLQATLVRYERLAEIPRTSGVYTAWLDASTPCFYVGLANSLWSRIRSHFSGQRGSDQFCLYVYDSYVHLQRCESMNRLTTKEVNTHTAEWIRRNIAFRWVELGAGDLLAAERYLHRTWRPTLNTLQAQS